MGRDSYSIQIIVCLQCGQQLILLIFTFISVPILVLILTLALTPTTHRSFLVSADQSDGER